MKTERGEIWKFAFLGAVAGLLSTTFFPILGGERLLDAFGYDGFGLEYVNWKTHIIVFGLAGAVWAYIRRLKQQANHTATSGGDASNTAAPETTRRESAGSAAKIIRERTANGYMLARGLLFAGALVVVAGIVAVLSGEEGPRGAPSSGIFIAGVLLSTVLLGLLLVAAAYHMRAALDRTVFAAPDLTNEEKLSLVQ